jgi:Glycosyltransferase family 87
MFKQIVLNTRTLFIVYALLALITVIQNLTLGSHTFTMPIKAPAGHDIVNNMDSLKLYVGKQVSHINNYTVFKQSWFHLQQNKNLYIIHANDQFDLFKYSPSFAVLFAPIAVLPDFWGLLIWNLLNTLVLFAAIRQLPMPGNKANIILWLMVIELLTSIQNEQSNALMAGLMILTYTCLQKGKSIWAALWVVLATYIKVYGAVAFCLFLFFPQKPKFILWSAIWALIIFCLPLLVVPMPQLLWQYQNWKTLLAADQSGSYGLSVMGWLHAWFHIEGVKNIVMLAGVVLFMLPLARIKLYGQGKFQLLFLANMLLWVIIFNHKAESPTFIIAFAGACIWFFASAANSWHKVMFTFVFIFTCLSVTDLFPHSIKDGFFTPYVIKAVPCIFLWLIIEVELLLMLPNKE